MDTLDTLLQQARNLARSAPEESLALAYRARPLCEMPDQHAQVLRLLTQVSFELGRATESEQLQGELEALLPSCSPAVQARCKSGLGWLGYLKSDYSQALTLTREALDALSRYGETEGELWVRNNLAAIYNSLGSTDKALALYVENRTRSQACGNRLMEGGSLLNICMLHNANADYQAGLETSLESLEILEESNDSYAKVLIRAQVITALLGLGRHAEALSRSDELLGLPQPLPMISALVHYKRAHIFRTCQEFEKALAAAETGLGFVPPQITEERFFLLSEKAQALEGLGELHESARLLREVLRNSERFRLDKNNSSLLELAARVAEKRRRYKEALDYHKKLHASERARLASTSERQRILFSVELQLEKARREADQERARSQQLEQEAARDGMTGLYNHATFQKLLRRECQAGMFTLILLDVDRFKSYNDTYGHPAGDTLLKELAALLTEQLRTDDILARYGGEEFAVILPGKSLALASPVAERLRSAVAACTRFERPVTISVGVAATPPLPPEPSLLLEAADRALYQAKRSGRDRVEVAEGRGKLGSS